MNITKDSAGSVSQKHILSKGFGIFKIDECNDMGQATYEFPQYKREDGVKITGGYWSYNIENKNGDVLFNGWWNSDEEFDETMSHVDYLIKYQPHTSRFNELQKKYDELHSSVKEYMSKDLSMNALWFKMHFQMMSEEDRELLDKQIPNNADKIETPFGTVEIFRSPIFTKNDE